MVNYNTVRDIILREKLIDYKCSMCGNCGEWNGRILQLQLHHIDGNRTNNSIENLTFLCPNCHTQTDNYGHKNVKQKKKKEYFCKVCGNKITKDTRTGLCKKCVNKEIFTKEIPTKDDLLATIKKIKYKKYVCYEYGICDHTLDNWLKQYGLPYHISEVHNFIRDNNI